MKYIAIFLALMIVTAEARPKKEPDLPWPCWQVVLATKIWTVAELRQKAKEANVHLSKHQVQQAKACLK